MFVSMYDRMYDTEASKLGPWAKPLQAVAQSLTEYFFFLRSSPTTQLLLFWCRTEQLEKATFFLVLLWPKESILFLCEPYWAGLGAVWSWFALMVRGPDEKWWKERSCFEEFCTCKCCWSLEHCGLWPIELGVCKSQFAGMDQKSVRTWSLYSFWEFVFRVLPVYEPPF